MKTIRLFPLFAVLPLFGACGAEAVLPVNASAQAPARVEAPAPERSPDVQRTGSVEPTPAGEPTARLVASVSALPECDATREGSLVYVRDVREFQTCAEGSWQVIDLRGPAGADGKDGLAGKDGTDGAQGVAGAAGAAGRDGADGRDGVDGQDGVDGTDGQDARPIIGKVFLGSQVVGVARSYMGSGDYWVDTPSGLKLFYEFNESSPSTVTFYAIMFESTDCSGQPLAQNVSDRRNVAKGYDGRFGVVLDEPMVSASIRSRLDANGACVASGFSGSDFSKLRWATSTEVAEASVNWTQTTLRRE